MAEYDEETRAVKPTPRTAQIRLSEAQRKKILKDLGVSGDISWVPDTIHVARIHRSQLGGAGELARPGSWILVMA